MPDSQGTTPSSCTRAQVHRVLCTLSARRGYLESAVTEEASLIDDLAFDSMELVDLSVALEAALGVRDLAVEQFIDLEATREGKRFTVGALMHWCVSMRERQFHWP